MPATIASETLAFLNKLADNNNKEWFAENKPTYEIALENMVNVVADVIALMQSHDQLEAKSAKRSLYRIYNDVRFHKNKPPYNPRFAFGFQRATKYLRGGYYVHIQPENSFLGLGFFNPNPEDLKTIRTDISINFEDWNAILNEPVFKQTFGTIQGDAVATAPKGFAKDHPAIDLLRHKSFVFRRNFSDAEVTGNEFAAEVSYSFQTARPFLDYMSELLTTDANGLPLY